MSHDMHAERCLLTRQALQSMAQQQVRIATGTTTLRTIESLFWWSLHWKVYGEWPEVLSQRSPYGELGKQAEALDWTDRDALSAILEHGPWKGQEHLSFETQLMIVPGYRIRMVQGWSPTFTNQEAHCSALWAPSLACRLGGRCMKRRFRRDIDS